MKQLLITAFLLACVTVPALAATDGQPVNAEMTLEFAFYIR